MNKHNKAKGLEPLVVLALFAFSVWLISTNANEITEDGRYVIGFGSITVLSTIVAFSMLGGRRLGKPQDKYTSQRC